MAKFTLPEKVLTDINGDVARMYLYGYIGSDEWWDEGRKELALTDTEILQKVQGLEENGASRLNVRINSFGGSIKDGDGIMATFKTSKMEVHGYVDGTAASMAADIFFSIPKENRHMAANSKIMVHSSRSGAYGTEQDMLNTAKMLRTFNEAAIANMVADTGMKESEVIERFYDGNDHWLSAKDCQELGLIVKIDDYEFEGDITGVEKLSHEEAMRRFDQSQGHTSHPLQGTNRFLRKSAAGTIPNKKSQQEMTKEELKAAVKNGELSLDDLSEELTGAGYEVNKTTPPAPPVTPSTVVKTEISKEEYDEQVASFVADAVAKANKPLLEKIAKLEGKPAGTPTPAKAANDPQPNTSDEATKVLDAFNDGMIKAAKNQDRIYIQK